MGDFLRRLLGLAEPAALPVTTLRAPSTLPNPSESTPSDASSFDSTGDAASIISRYFELSIAIEQAKATHDYRAAIAAARATFPILPGVVRAMVAEYGAFNICKSHAIHTGATLMAVMSDRDGLRELRGVLESVPELRGWLDSADKADADADLVDGMLAAIHATPGLSQAELKRDLHTEDGRRLSALGSWLEKASRLCRIKAGSSYRFYPADYRMSADATAAQVVAAPVDGVSAATPVSTPLAVRTMPSRPAVAARTLNLDGLPYVRLPRAPLRWEQRDDAASGEGRSEAAEWVAAHRFSADGDGWRIASEEKLGAADRPDPAFKTMFPTAGATYWLDPKGHREDFADAAAVLRVTDRAGSFTGERGLTWDVYRSDVNANGSGILFLSRGGVLHGYDAELQPLIAQRAADLPEYRAQATRLGIQDNDLRTRVRCVAIANDCSRYLITAVDEVWCYGTARDEVLWGLRFPMQEGWKRVAQPRSQRTGTSAEVVDALRLLELELPVTPDEIARQYRALAMRWHPDRNPGDPSATARFQRLGAAVELVTGVDLSGMMESEVEQVTYEKILQRSVVDVGAGQSLTVSFAIGTSELSAADWIYAANFGATAHRSYAASYSGKVVEVAGDGMAVRIYDIGSVPRQILETADHLYILTDTRLYVLSGDRLDALVDVFDAGTLIVADAGFGLLQAKAFRWFTPTGRQVGHVRSKDPIRRVFPAPGGLVVETRQHRARVSGAPDWWNGSAARPVEAPVVSGE